jgi:hypothetical protein
MGFVALAALATLHSQTASGPVSLRFHHLHYRVADPGDALGVAAEAFRGTRTILQGLGVGVRVGRQYVLIERADSRGLSGPGENPAGAYAEAARWLRARGLPVEPASLAETAVAKPFPDARLDHVAFAADTLGPVLASLDAKPVSVNDERSLFRLPSGALLEIVRDTDRPDLYWCPMHPDVRSPSTGTCRLCAMPLVLIPPPRLGEYKLDITVHPRAGGGASGLTLAVRDPETGDPVTSFIDVHERPFHLFILSRDLARFAHVHPEPAPDGAFELRQDIEAGEHMLIADFLPAGGTTQLVQRAVVTPGYSGPLFRPVPELMPTAPERTVDGLRIRVDAPSLVARRESGVRLHLSDATTAVPIRDLEPYLGASGHLLIVSQDATAAIHAHPDGAPTTGPTVTFTPVFPAPGRYKMWAQFQRKGAVVTAAFVIDVPQP